MTVELNDLFRDAFGYELPTGKLVISEQNNINRVAGLGQPYFSEDEYGREFFMPVRIDTTLIPFAVISAINLKKNIIETAMPERNGEVNEGISFSSPIFNIKGIIIRDDNNFPEDDTINLNNIWRKNTSLSLRSALSDIFLSGVFDHRVIIRNMSWRMTPGVQHAIAFEMDVKADEIFDLELD